ncbi:hypothetical protein [Tabrizicola sp.]|uniref:hypothetical protein n=1 Tax=Tabrizicola sp. TaxID=2005166 RepID=UPI002869F85F|nr:hypothetical protein [Tabrizicola sp.]
MTGADEFVLTFPADEAGLVRQHYAAAASILEYGSGGSTVLAAELGKPVFSVESDAAWAERLRHHLVDISGTAVIHHVDIGLTKDWGYPINSQAYRAFHRYALSVWDRPDFIHPDVVLIDGRFRAACFAATMMRCTRPVTVLFDDYTARRYYHRVEALVARDETVGRLARFTVVPRQIPPEMLTEVIGWFSDPR